MLGRRVRPDALGRGRYRLTERLLGTGRAGSLQVGTHLGHGHRVAIRLLPDRLRDDPAAAARALTAARRQQRVEDEHVAIVYDAAQEDGRLFVVTELCAGGALAQLLAHDDDRLPYEIAAPLFADAASGLAAAHAQGLIHGRLTASDLLLDRTGAVKVADFGLVDAVEGRREPGTWEDDVRALLMLLCGTLSGGALATDEQRAAAAARLADGTDVPESVAALLTSALAGGHRPLPTAAALAMHLRASSPATDRQRRTLARRVSALLPSKPVDPPEPVPGARPERQTAAPPPSRTRMTTIATCGALMWVAVPAWLCVVLLGGVLGSDALLDAAFRLAGGIAVVAFYLALLLQLERWQLERRTGRRTNAPLVLGRHGRVLAVGAVVAAAAAGLVLVLAIAVLTTSSSGVETAGRIAAGVLAATLAGYPVLLLQARESYGVPEAIDLLVSRGAAVAIGVSVLALGLLLQPHAGMAPAIVLVGVVGAALLLGAWQAPRAASIQQPSLRGSLALASAAACLGAGVAALGLAGYLAVDLAERIGA